MRSIDNMLGTPLTAATLVEIPPGHDRWVIGAEDHVSPHLLGAHAYAQERTP